MSVILSLSKALKVIINALSPADKWTYYSTIEKIMSVEKEIFRRTEKIPTCSGRATIKASVLQGFDKEHIMQRVLSSGYCLEKKVLK